MSRRTLQPVSLITPSPTEHVFGSSVPNGALWSRDSKDSSSEDELDIRNVSAFDEWDGDDTVCDDQDYYLHNHRNMNDIHRVLSFDEVIYNDDGRDDQYLHDELMWSISLSNRCHKSLQALFLPSSKPNEEQSLTSSQATKLTSNKKQQAKGLPSIRKLSLSPAFDTITGATVDSSMYTETSDNSNASNSISSSSSWNSMWCCGMSHSYSDDSVDCIQRRLFSSPPELASQIPDVVVTKKYIGCSSEHLLRQLETDEDRSGSITVFEDDNDSFWSV